MMKTCKNCSFPISDIEEYCDACEALNSNVFKCPQCQATISPKHDVCHQCGVNITSTCSDSTNPLNSLAAQPGCCVRMVIKKDED